MFFLFKKKQYLCSVFWKIWGFVDETGSNPLANEPLNNKKS